MASRAWYADLDQLLTWFHSLNFELVDEYARLNLARDRQVHIIERTLLENATPLLLRLSETHLQLLREIKTVRQVLQLASPTLARLGDDRLTGWTHRDLMATYVHNNGTDAK
jgi:hypothetical protein